MECNIVFCGPAHSGKSTLAGYILVNSQTDMELERLDEKIRTELGNRYDNSRRFSYYVDTADIERNKSSKAIGTSKHVHMQRITFEQDLPDVLLIDSPGSHMKWKSRYQAYFMGDIAVTIFELSDFEKLYSKIQDKKSFTAARKKLLWPLYLWKEYKNLNNMIIVISKMDGIDFEHNDYYREDFDRFAFGKARTVLHWDSDFDNIPVIPISINIKDRKEYNVYTKAVQMPWYTGNTLMEELSQKVKQYLKTEQKDIPYLFASIEKRLKVRTTQEPAFRIKVINGQLCKKDSVYLTQVASTEKAKFETGEVTIKSLKKEEGKITDHFASGDIGGAILSKITINGKSVAPIDVKLSRASYLIDKRMNIKTGNLLFFKNLFKNDNFSDLQLHDKINILMFGKIVSTTLVSKDVRDGICYISVFAQNYPITLPILDDSSLPFSKYTIEKENMEFMSVELYSLESIDDNTQYCLTINCKGKELDRDIIKSAFNNCRFLVDTQSDFCINVSAKTIESVTNHLRVFFRKHKFTDYSTKLTLIENLDKVNC